ncbi:proline-rich proteoglycan 2-like [Suncus etruscus]|uniref:proline-rich proteoglycan 2-like n=1 Tax=Suncus etruscus TaxID=109475 RepID=UPI002110656A|nr:proline-rich proteoglycan 2-like [Suncus etruscus]
MERLHDIPGSRPTPEPDLSSLQRSDSSNETVHGSRSAKSTGYPQSPGCPGARAHELTLSDPEKSSLFSSGRSPPPPTVLGSGIALRFPHQGTPVHGPDQPHGQCLQPGKISSGLAAGRVGPRAASPRGQRAGFPESPEPTPPSNVAPRHLPLLMARGRRRQGCRALGSAWQAQVLTRPPIVFFERQAKPPPGLNPPLNPAGREQPETRSSDTPKPGGPPTPPRFHFSLPVSSSPHIYAP